MQRKIILKVRLILIHHGKILLLKQQKHTGGNYTLVGGTIESEEFAVESLIRESKEEAGIDIRRKDLSLAHVLHKKTKGGERVTLYFMAKKWEGKIRALEPEKFAAALWFPQDDLPHNLTETVRHVLRCYREGKMYSEFKEK